jgi:hypothetical protein
MIAARIGDIRSFFVFCRMGHLFANGTGGWWQVPKVGFIVEPRGLAQPHCHRARWDVRRMPIKLGVMPKNYAGIMPRKAERSE